MTSRTRLLLSAGAAALLLGAQPAAAQKKGGNVVYANLSGVESLDPTSASSVVALETASHIFEGLVAMGEDYTAKPSLASKVEVAPDAQGVTFTLRKGVKFHNGKEMTSEDVLASYQRYKRVSPGAAALADVTSMEAPDPYTFVIKLGKPNAVFVDVLKTPTFQFAILPSEQKDKAAREIDFIGTGPFKLVEWVRDSHILLRRNDDYSIDTSYPGPDGLAGRKTVWVDTVRVNFVPEANARVAALQSGGADVAAQVPVETAKRIDGQNGISVLKVIPYCQQTFVMNTQAAPTNNALIRRAMQALLDVDDIGAVSELIYERNPSLQFRTSPYFEEAVGKPFYDMKSPDKAKALLKEAGYKGEKIILQTNASYTYMKNAILWLTEAMKGVGMNAEVSMVDWPTNANNMTLGTGTWNVSVTGFCSAPLLGPQQWRSFLYGFAQLKQGDPVMDEAYKTFFASVDFGKRKDAWNAIEKQVLSQAYMMKVTDFADVRAAGPRFTGVKPYYFTRFWDVWQK